MTVNWDRNPIQYIYIYICIHFKLEKTHRRMRVKVELLNS